MAAISSDHEIRANLQLSVRRFRSNADDAVSFFYQISDFCLHLQLERWIAGRVFGDEIQEVPLRHERDELTSCRQVRKVSQRNRFIADLSDHLGHFGVRPFEKVFEEAQLVHQLERGWMNRVAAKVAQKICVLLEHDDFYARTRQQEAQHHPRRATTGDAASCVHLSFMVSEL